MSAVCSHIHKTMIDLLVAGMEKNISVIILMFMDTGMGDRNLVVKITPFFCFGGFYASLYP